MGSGTDARIPRHIIGAINVENIRETSSVVPTGDSYFDACDCVATYIVC